MVEYKSYTKFLRKEIHERSSCLAKGNTDMKAYERLLKYVKFDTKSSGESGTHPSTEGQFALAEVLLEELLALVCQGVTLTDKCYVYAALPATAGCEGGAKLGFIAHLDTAPDFSGAGVNPIITENYDGGELSLGAGGRVLSPEMFPHLPSLRGRTLITTDGTTLRGADNKAGVAEIMTLIEELTVSGAPHGELHFAFTPDEEIGEGADFFDVEGFGCDFAYTVDGGAEGSLEFENFNAASAKFEINGTSVHPGSAKDVMVNAALLAMEINSMLPSAEIPAKTEGYEGFYHLTDMSGDVSRASLSYIVRDHSATLFDAKLATLRHAEKVMNEKYGAGCVTLTIKEQYRNMREMIEPCMHLVDSAVAAAKSLGVTPTVEPIRGGTDGARLSYMGLPCPNLGTGGYAFHGPYEHITVEGMELATKILLKLVDTYKSHIM